MRASTVIMQLVIPDLGVGKAALLDVRRSHGRPERSRIVSVSSLITAGGSWLPFCLYLPMAISQKSGSLCESTLGPHLALVRRLPESINLGVPK